MRTRFLSGFIALTALGLSVTRHSVAEPSSAGGPNGAVASVSPLASQAGLDTLKSGGNAIDAAIAVALTLGVVDGHNSGIGGGCFLLIRLADGTTAAIDGREIAPAASKPAMFFRDGKPDTELSQTGPLAVGVPGALAAYAYASEKFGKKPLAALLLPAADLAERGFAIDSVYAHKLVDTASKLALFEGTKAIFLNPDGSPLKEGETLKQADLAATYRAIARDGTKWFYDGPFAEKVGAWMASHGGVLAAKDFADYRLELREPILSKYRDFDILAFPPPSSGGVHLVQILNILEGFDLKAMPESTRIHVIAEAMKLAFADRAYWLGDPAFTPVPRGLLSKDYARSLAAKISTEHSTPVPTHGEPPAASEDVFKKHTTHFSVADAQGNWVACTATINTSFGSKVVVPGTGVLLNNEMDDFSIAVGVPNHFKLVGSEANAVAPGKRPLSSMTPTIVIKGGKPIISIGAAGGPTIISQTVINLVGLLDLGLSPAEALAQKRYHHQWQPDELRIEESMPKEIQDRLAAMGHTLKPVKIVGASNVVAITSDQITGASEPRVPGKALAW